jgi:SAM-dependent methyltransferase
MSAPAPRDRLCSDSFLCEINLSPASLDSERDDHCLLCGREQPFPALFSRQGYTVVRCPQCGLVFQHPQPSPEALERSYYFDPDFSQALLGPYRKLTLARAREKLPGVRAATGRRGGRLLDVGCSSGAWLEVAAEEGWRGTGVEIGPTTAAEARERGLDVRTGTLADVAPDLGDERFDLITFWDVLEHLRDPLAELAQARALLAPGGTLAATFPNVEGWFPRLTHRLLAGRGIWEHPELPVHLYDFSPVTAAAMFRRSGLEPSLQRTWGVPFRHYLETTLTPSILGGGARARAIRWGLWSLHLAVYPAARLFGRGNYQFIAAEATRAGTEPKPPISAATAAIESTGPRRGRQPSS